MSVTAMGRVWDVAAEHGLTDKERLLLVALADHYDDVRRCAYPGRRRLAECIGCHPKTVQRLLTRLRGLGLVEARNSPGRGHHGAYALPWVHEGEQMDALQALSKTERTSAPQTHAKRSQWDTNGERRSVRKGEHLGSTYGAPEHKRYNSNTTSTREARSFAQRASQEAGTHDAGPSLSPVAEAELQLANARELRAKLAALAPETPGVGRRLAEADEQIASWSAELARRCMAVTDHDNMKPAGPVQIDLIVVQTEQMASPSIVETAREQWDTSGR